MPPPRPERDLSALIRRSRVLDPVLKRRWLRLLPHLSPLDRARLHEILALETGAEPAESAGRAR